jgi:hypothetical protein
MNRENLKVIAKGTGAILLYTALALLLISILG